MGGKETVVFQAGDSIIKSGQKEQRMYIIVKGEVEISINDGMRKVVMATLKKNEFFGEMSLFLKTPRTADAVALAKTELTCIDSSKELDAFLEKNPSFSRQMVQVLGQRLAKTNDLLKEELRGRGKSVMVGFSW